MMKMSNKVKNILEWIFCIVIAIVVALLIRYFIGTPTVVKHSSMSPTLQQNQRLILNKLPKMFNEIPERGDIITFEAPTNSTAKSVKAEYEYNPKTWYEKFIYYVLEIGKSSYIKRVIALPGEQVKIENGKIYIDEQELQEDYLQNTVMTETKNSNLTNFVVPEGYIFAIGDNRSGSFDCRDFGCIPIDKIESIVWIRFWPLNLLGIVE